MKKKIIIIMILVFLIFACINVVYAMEDSDYDNSMEGNGSATIYSIFIPVVSLIFVYIARNIFKTNYDKNLPETIEYYPPNNYNPIELELLKEGKVTKNGLVASLLYFANKGYINIEEYFENSVHEEFKELQIKTNKIKIIKIKEYDGVNQIEKNFLEELFSEGNEIELDKDNGKNKLWISFNIIASKINNDSNETIIYSSDLKQKKKKTYFMIITIFILMIARLIVEGEFALFITNLAFLIPVFCSLLLFNLVITKKYESKDKEMIMLYPLSIILLIILLSAFLLFTKIFIDVNILIKSCYFISIFLIMLLDKFIIFPKRNKFGYEMLHKIKMYKKSLKKMNIDQFEELMRENNNEYFFNTLPYVYTLDIAEDFINNFESFVQNKPSWFITEKDYNICEINIKISNFIKTLQDYWD